ncbi:carboxypeptidase B isoform X1 [Drosophila suzukii]|uniref:Carboxypeptidase B isoform X1 n=1 Tax=Drosophila suzukii TaxID=28584 RepID=A0ABM4TVF3_DROSZ
MSLLLWQWAWLAVVLLIAGKMEQVGGRNHLDLARTDNRLTRLPFFGGGVGHLLRYLNPLSPHPSTERGRISELRSDLDANYVSYRGAQLWKLNFNATRGSSMEEREPGEEEEQVEPEERQVLASPDAQFNEVVALFGSEVWNINQDGIDILIEQRNVADAKKFMDKVGFSYNIMIDDIESAIDETYVEVPAVEHPLDSVRNNSLPWMERPGSLMTWRRYHDHADIQQFLQTLLETYSENVELIQIGVTRNKRPLEVIRVSNGNPDNWAVFVDAGLQARDWLSPAALTYAISKLTHLWARPKGQGQGQRQSRADKAMRRIDWYFLPLANPDGYQYSRHTDRLWTKNRGYDSDSGCYGVNLDRNFQYGWGGTGSTSNPCMNLYRGAESFSEPESRAIRSFLSGMREYLGAYVSLSGYGQTITYPWGDADYVTENQRDLKQTARRAVLALRRLNQAEYSSGTSYKQKLARPGNSADWVQDRIEPQLVFNMFLKDQGRYGYLLPPHYIVESGEEVFEFLRTIAQQLE